MFLLSRNTARGKFTQHDVQRITGHASQEISSSCRRVHHIAMQEIPHTHQQFVHARHVRAFVRDRFYQVNGSGYEQVHTVHLALG